ncbi:hypothetical protein DFQ27_008994 [Actinomortierella ambigua]|uniref:Uncharacterized protein n=1 Tax=Actinomortierella ambigua TaxID=1343610 RepID=A0A9P6QIY9_9FUNG|nr:hypothetical protein DFQ27_008994 [Actinomortierella ambigua]
MLIRTIALITACATMAFAGGATVSRGRFLGVDTTKRDSDPVEMYRDPANHATAAVSILRGLAVEAEYFPQEDSPAELAAKSFDWTSSLFDSSALKADRSVQRTIRFDGDKESLGATITSAIAELPNSKYVGHELAQMVPKQIADLDLTRWSLSLVIVDKPADDSSVKAYVYDLSLQIKPRGAGVEVILPRQTLIFSQQSFTLDAEDVESKAEQYANEYGVTEMEDFKWFFESKDSSSEVNWSSCRSGSRRLSFQALENWL